MAAASTSSADAGNGCRDDEVITELDVYLSKALADNLFLLQYSEQPPSSRNARQVVEARVKLNKRNLELEYLVRTGNPANSRKLPSDSANSGADQSTEVDLAAGSIDDRCIKTELWTSSSTNQCLDVKPAIHTSDDQNSDVRPVTDAGVIQFMEAEPVLNAAIRHIINDRKEDVPASSSTPRGPVPDFGTGQSTEIPAQLSERLRLVDRLVMTSTDSSVSPESSAVGLLFSGELHLSPLSAVFRMAPTMLHMDQMPAVFPTFETSEENGEQGSEVEPREEVDELFFATRSFEDGSDEEFRRAFEQPVEEENEEPPWVEATFHGFGTEMSLVERQLLICPETREEVPFRPAASQRFLQDLIDGHTTENVPEQAHPIADSVQDKENPEERSMHGLRCLLLEDRIKTILRNANVVEFSKLMSVLPAKSDSAMVLVFLEQVAVLVQGCWVVKSEVLYPSGSFSPRTGVRAKILQRARDLLLLLYTESRHVMEPMFTQSLKYRGSSLPEEDVRALLQGIATPSPAGWEFKVACDRNFINQYPDVAQRQTDLWSEKRVIISKTFRFPAQDEFQETVPSQPTADTTRRIQRRPVNFRNHARISQDHTQVTNGAELAGGAENETPPICRHDRQDTSFRSGSAGPPSKLKKTSV
ncbi:hypothetical protein V5799_008464 [Amblyomma americanum]|uniref:DNA-directed RNA polymerase III subunit RPC5 n=1 Tax=Amblyomma americanum TaxID=6943 RepID=A0AAQ4FD72_AMBAM